MHIVIVESPAKAKTINKYLGEQYKVLASYGHIRDLPAKDGSVRPKEGFAMDWDIDPKSKKHVDSIVDAAKSADAIYLATDPDREGEAISWHVLQELQDRKVLDGRLVKRVTFNAITKNAVLEAIENPRDLDRALVDAYLARRALDYLVGFNLSPVLWRKLPGSKSAGRVQSVALRLICERETEIEKFSAQEYWTIDVDLAVPSGETFAARLTHLNGNKLDKFDLNNENATTQAKQSILGKQFSVETVERRKKQRRPYAPFTTSTLQQDASRRLYFSAKQTMDTAQRLYEGINIGGETVGLITYMRTDGVQIDTSVIGDIRNLVSEKFGSQYLPQSPRMYKTKAKNAQEAHEAIRPTDPSLQPNHISKYLNQDQLKLYELIWKRTIASQMEAAELDQVTVVATSADRLIKLRASGSVVTFQGFLKLYEESPKHTDNQDENDTHGLILPPVSECDPLNIGNVAADQHFTQPPPRYSEASLVKSMEEMGIGRPSTYASIIQVLQTREYVRMEKRRFMPEDRGRVVIAFLESFFKKYVEYNFTADLENQLDDISGGRLEWKQVLSEFWHDFIAAINDTKDLSRTEVIDAVDALLEPHLFPATTDGQDPRQCPACSDGRLSLKFGKFGGFIGCTDYPTCKYTRPLAVNGQGAEHAQITANGPKELGTDTTTGLTVTLRIGPYGPYVQLGEAETADITQEGTKKNSKGKPRTKAKKPKRSALPKGMDPVTVTLEQALKLLALPREIGLEPESGDMIFAGIGRYGPYLKVASRYQSLSKDDNVLDIGLNRAVVVLAEGKKKQPRRPQGKSLGEHPKDGKEITLRTGRYGPYVQHGKIRATLPKDMATSDMTLQVAADLLAAKVAKQSGKSKSSGSRKATAKKA